MQTPELPSDPVYHDEDAARSYIEDVRWPDFVTCPLCGAFDMINMLGGGSMGPGGIGGRLRDRARANSPCASESDFRALCLSRSTSGCSRSA